MFKKLHINNKVDVYTRQKVIGLRNEEQNDGTYRNRGIVVGIDSTGVYEVKFKSQSESKITKYVKIDEDPQHIMSIKDGDPMRSNIEKVKIIN